MGEGTRKPRREDDTTLFRDSVRGARRLAQDRAAPYRPRTRPVPRQRLEDEARVLEEMVAFDPGDEDVETGEELAYAREGVQHGLMRKLRRGNYVIEAELDLHGLTVPEAREALGRFVAVSQAAGKRCVRIIHGKGLSSPGRKPVLKSRLNAWLQQSGDILAFCSARPNDGGTGAVYVLLRRRA